MLIKIAIIFVIGLVGGTLMAIPYVDAAPGNQGTPFEAVWDAIANLGQTLGTISCEDGHTVKWDDASGEWVCANGSGATELNIETFEGEMVVASSPRLWSATAECPDGTKVTGGGHRSLGFSGSVEGIIVENRQLNENTWRVQFSYDQDGSGFYAYKAIVHCTSMSP